MEFAQIFNKNNIRDFVQGNYYTLVYKLNSGGIPQHIKEQAVYRAMLCSDCLKNRSCPKCGCRTPNMFFAPNKVCKEQKWEEMIDDPEKWEAYKLEYKIELELDFDSLLEKEKEDDRHTG